MSSQAAATVTDPVVVAFDRGLLDVPLGSPTRPSWRGRIHLLALAAAVPLAVVLAIISSDAQARAGVIVYGVGLCSMLAVSVTYHRWRHTIRARARWRRADHATIYAAIGGTFTPLCLVALDVGWSIAMLIIVWSAALVGVLLKALDWRHAHTVGIVLYLGIGWTGVLLIPALWTTSGVLPVALLVGGGIAYTVGAVGFGRQWPAAGSTVFSYHEVWHVWTVVAAAAHLAAVWIVVT